jgi:hypothetical protein
VQKQFGQKKNNIDLSLALLTKLKIMAMGIDLSTLSADGIYYDQLDSSCE